MLYSLNYSGQTRHWVLGTTIVSITTSSAGGKAINNGFCDKCAELKTTTTTTATTTTTEDPQQLVNGASKGSSSSTAPRDLREEKGVVEARKRHQSSITPPTVSRPLSQPRSQDDAQLATKTVASQPEWKKVGVLGIRLCVVDLFPWFLAVLVIILICITK